MLNFLWAIDYATKIMAVEKARSYQKNSYFQQFFLKFESF